MLNNREAAIIFWLLVLLVFCLKDKNFRNAFKNLLSVFFKTKILLFIFIMILYNVAVICFFQKCGIWTTGMLKDTVIWFFLVALAMVMRYLPSGDDQKRIFRQVISDNFKIIIVIEFIIGFYVFSLPVELILVPILGFLNIISELARYQKYDTRVTALVERMLEVIGIAILVVAFSKAFNDIYRLGTMETFLKIMLPPLLSIAFIPFVYSLIVVDFYQSARIRLLLGPSKPRNLVWYALYRIFCSINFSLVKMQIFRNHFMGNLVQIRTKEDVDRLVELEWKDKCKR